MNIVFTFLVCLLAVMQISGMTINSGGSGGMNIEAGGTGSISIPQATAGGADYSDITFYHDADALDNANYASGSAVLTFDAGILTVAGVVGTAWDNNNDGFDNIDISTPSNLDYGASRMGFYWTPQEVADGYIWFMASAGSNYFQYLSATQTRMRFGGVTEDCTTNFTATTDYFLEFIFTGTGLALEIDGSPVCSIVGATEPNETFSFFSVDGNAWDAHIDQLFISNDTSRDLNAIKNCTNCHP